MRRWRLDFNGTRHDFKWRNPQFPYHCLESGCRAVGRIFLCLKCNVIETTRFPCCLYNIKKHKICILTTIIIISINSGDRVVVYIKRTWLSALNLSNAALQSGVSSRRRSSVMVSGTGPQPNRYSGFIFGRAIASKGCDVRNKLL
jgi:hypothetical protein